eukprot:TRINITY_DN6854_c0_g1_i5.p1 TRINITY_DN6854_c0_g1~~TRINITY_DN6854_c0_g1_i5.p1  ORF type:complete len:447 (-),score=89.97 TRINITY_DN6854_c0_g1_i5:245-1585(-)
MGRKLGSSYNSLENEKSNTNTSSNGNDNATIATVTGTGTGTGTGMGMGTGTGTGTGTATTMNGTSNGSPRVPSSHNSNNHHQHHYRQGSNEHANFRAVHFSGQETDFLYQRERILTFKKLLKRYPETKVKITKEARENIPPVLRGEIWAAILGVESQEVLEKFWNSIDFSVVHPSDYQISLDVPRCHQYHHLLSSPEGHTKLSLVLQAWVRCNPSLNYWQGIDSLVAPFLTLHFNNLPKALYCLQQVVELYLKPFFHKEKSIYLQEHLTIYKQLLSYLDPELAMHLHKERFNPDLYAIPWFLTLFAHIFSLDKIVKIWDILLISPPSLPLFIAVAIVQQLREVLLEMDFNDCILFFSGMPPINIERCLKVALKKLQRTPPSVTTHICQKEQPIWERRPPLEELEKELFPRISTSDIINEKSHIIILDVRNDEQYPSLMTPKQMERS